MTRRGWAIALASLGLAAALVLAWLRPAGRSMAEPAAAPAPAATPAAARRCITPTPQALQALRQGTQRVVVVVTAFQPPKPPGAGLVLSLLGANGIRHQLSRVAVHPLRAFSAREPERSQRFLLSLEPVAHLLETGKPLCFEMNFGGANGLAEGGSAEIEIELAPLPGGPAR